jgi:hypothetical protein
LLDDGLDQAVGLEVIDHGLLGLGGEAMERGVGSWFGVGCHGDFRIGVWFFAVWPRGKNAKGIRRRDAEGKMPERRALVNRGILAVQGGNLRKNPICYGPLLILI